MARILIAWELGEAFGHLARCLRLAEGLRQRGHAVVLAVKDVRLPAGCGTGQGITVLQAPLTPQHRPADRRMPVNYADVLRDSGFTDAQDVSARLLAWHGLFSLAHPEVLVADHAPTALLAAHLVDIPHLAIGNGFTIPPSTRPWPSIRPWEQISDETLFAAEQRLDRVTEVAQKALGHAAPVRMRKLFGARDVLDTFAEIDHYGERANSRYIGPIVTMSNARRVRWQDPGAAKVLAYLRPAVPGFATILQALARLDAEALCVAPGLSPEVARRLATHCLRISLVPVDLPPLLEHADLAISYGNAGFSTQALLAGVPLLIRPRYVEQTLFARRVEALGVGKQLNGRIEVDTVTATLQTLLSDPDDRRAAQAFHESYCHFSPEQAVEGALSLIEQSFLDGRGSDCTRHALESQEKPRACLQ